MHVVRKGDTTGALHRFGPPTWVDVYLRENTRRLVGTRCVGRIPTFRRPEVP